MSEHAICTACGKIYDTELLVRNYDYDANACVYHCPDIGCGGSCVPCDDLIMPSIYELNRKGFPTYFSCSGHYGERVNATYIVFGVPSDIVLDDTIQNIIQQDYHGIRYEATLYERRLDDDGHYIMESYGENRVLRSGEDGYCTPEMQQFIDNAADEMQHEGKDIVIRLAVREDEDTPSHYRIGADVKHYLIDVNDGIYDMISRFSKDYELILK